MTLQQAINSGLRFTRPGFLKDRWLSYRGEASHMCFDYGSFNVYRDTYHPTKGDILATDWIVEEKLVQVSESVLVQAFAEAQKDVCSQQRRYDEYLAPGPLSELFRAMLRRLGL